MSTAPAPALSDPVYLVERYLSPADQTDLVAAVSRVAAACRATYGTPAQVDHINSTFVPAEDTCFCVFRAPSRAAVEAANLTACFSYDRISDAELLVPAPRAGNREPTKVT